MAFFDLPIIDAPSADSERSERAVRDFLNQHTGYICRNDFPDKGCDLDIELITGGVAASNRRFGLQLKSVQKLPLLADGQTISYPFETSRLGYLLNRPIGEGLIVLYDVVNNRLYYEFALKVYQRLMQERGSDDWQDLHSVNIHIPADNALTAEAASVIHEHFTKRFETAAFLIASQGARYGIEVAMQAKDSRYDTHNPESVRDLLLDYGMSLLQDNELDLCFWLLRSLPQSEIDKYGELMLLAAITYGETGRRYESENLIRKLYRQNKVPPLQEAMVGYCHLKNQLVLDQISVDEFIIGAKKIRDTETSNYNQVIIDLNIIYYELVMLKFYHQVPGDVPDRIRSLFARIAELPISSRNQRLLEVINAENLAQYINFFRLNYFHDLALFRSSQLPGRRQQLKADRDLLAQLNLELNNNLWKLYTSAQEESDKLLQAQALLVRSRYLYAQEIDLFSQGGLLKLKNHDESMYKEHIRLCLHGHDLFSEVGYMEQASQCLCVAIELILVGRSRYQYEDGLVLDDLLALKDKLESEQETEPYELQFPQMEKRMATMSIERETRYMIDTKDLDDQQIDGLARSIGKAFLLPATSQVNLTNELRECRLFYEHNLDEIDLLPYDRNYDQRQVYRFPVRFVIRNKRTGIQSMPNHSVQKLLDSWDIRC